MVISGDQAGLRKKDLLSVLIHMGSRGRARERQDGPWLSLGSLWLKSERQKT